MRTSRHTGSRDRHERGSFTLELAVLFPVFLLLVLLIVQAALYFFARSVALSAAEQGAATARLQGHHAADGVRAATAFVTDQGGGVLTGLAVSATGSTPTEVSIVVTGHPLAIVPGLGFTIRQVASAPRETYTTATATLTSGNLASPALAGGTR
ncbi:MAG: TadE/TadG family type IV pilus assembly protein [Mycobacteriales bacterium]